MILGIGPEFSEKYNVIKIISITKYLSSLIEKKMLLDEFNVTNVDTNNPFKPLTIDYGRSVHIPTLTSHYLIKTTLY